MAGELLKDLDLGYAVVRVYAGRRTEEERKEAITNAAKELFKSAAKRGVHPFDVSNRAVGVPDIVSNSAGNRDACGGRDQSGAHTGADHAAG